MIEIPPLSSLRVSQQTSVPAKQQLDSMSHLLVVVPPRSQDTIFRGMPAKNWLARLKKRASQRPGHAASGRLDTQRATGVTVCITAFESPYRQLEWARKTLERCAGEDRGKLAVVVLGFSKEERIELLCSLVAAADAAAFALPSFKSKRRDKGNAFRSLRLFVPDGRIELDEVRAVAAGNNIARWLTAMPPNKLPAVKFREAVETIARDHGIQFAFIGEDGLSQRNAGAFLAVSQGNADRDAGIAHLRYQPAQTANSTISLVGKGILFDTGGNNLKPFKGMLDMHMDMQGSAVALGTLIALARLEVDFAIDAWLAVTENRISARAYKSQDVVSASNGTTVQIIHTDAEGRMVLADSLAIASESKPDLLIDYATLTGTCVSALTDRYSGVFTNRPAANRILIEAGQRAGERVWPFPMDDDFDEPLKSDVADIKQCAVDGAGDHILAARFLSRFVPKTVPWIHIDLSASQHKGGLAHIPTECTGFGVRFSVELLLRQLPPNSAKRILIS